MRGCEELVGGGRHIGVEPPAHTEGAHEAGLRLPRPLRFQDLPCRRPVGCLWVVHEKEESLE